MKTQLKSMNSTPHLLINTGHHEHSYCIHFKFNALRRAIPTPRHTRLVHSCLKCSVEIHQVLQKWECVIRVRLMLSICARKPGYGWAILPGGQNLRSSGLVTSFCAQWALSPTEMCPVICASFSPPCLTYISQLLVSQSPHPSNSLEHSIPPLSSHLRCSLNF